MNTLLSLSPVEHTFFIALPLHFEVGTIILRESRVWGIEPGALNVVSTNFIAESHCRQEFRISAFEHQAARVASI